MLGHNSDWWNGVMLLFLGCIALAACFVVVATTAVIIVQKREARAAAQEFEQYKLGVEGKVSDAKKAGIEAGEGRRCFGARCQLGKGCR